MSTPQIERQSDERSLPQTLHANDADDFLSYLFSDLGVRSQPFGLKEGAEVARYLLSLGRSAIPSAMAKSGEEVTRPDGYTIRARQMIQNAADVVWGTTLQCGEFSPSTKIEAVQFLKRHKNTHFRLPHIDTLLGLIESHDIPPNAPLAGHVPSLMARNMSVRATSTFGDDLSDRICGAYYALPRAGLRKERSLRIAKALSASQGDEWVGEDVNERVKGYRKSNRRRLKSMGLSGAVLAAHLLQFENGRADYWLSSFHFKRQSEQNFPAPVWQP